MRRTRYNRLPRCPHGHLLVSGNLIRHGTPWVCRTCNVHACARWYARQQSQKVLATEEES
jgi:hypothetical protein